MKLQVYRTNASSYQSSLFLSKEQRVLEEIEGIKYIQSLKEMDENLPFVLITNTHTKFEEISPNILEKTVLMVHRNSGHDNICADFVKNSTFPIVVGNPIRSNAVVEYTLSCIFQHFTQIPNHQHWAETRIWDRKLLRDQKVMILGQGHIGKLLEQSLKPLAREVIVYDPFAHNDHLNQNIKTSWNEDMFQDVSVLLLAASLNPTSYQMIDQKVLKKISSSCLIVNPARGEIIKEIDLVQFLQKNPKAYAYLDVFEKEPFKPGYLHELSNLNKTSHIAGVYEKLNSDIISFEYLIIKDFIEHYSCDNISNFHQEYEECLLTEEEYNKHETKT